MSKQSTTESDAVGVERGAIGTLVALHRQNPWSAVSLYAYLVFIAGTMPLVSNAYGSAVVFGYALMSAYLFIYFTPRWTLDEDELGTEISGHGWRHIIKGNDGD